MRGIFNNKNGKVNQSYAGNFDDLENSSYNSADILDNAKLIINNKLGNHFKSSKLTHLNDTNQEDFDLQTYKKFLSFLKFEEMMDKYNT